MNSDPGSVTIHANSFRNLANRCLITRDSRINMSLKPIGSNVPFRSRFDLISTLLGHEILCRGSYLIWIYIVVHSPMNQFV